MRNILICDDQELNHRLYRAFLRNEPYGLRSVLTGADAIAALAAGDFSLVLMDIMMPDMDGFEAARRIRRLPRPGGTVPIVAVTSLSPDVQPKCLAAGMNGYLAKPIRKDAFLAAIARHIEAKTSARFIIG